MPCLGVRVEWFMLKNGNLRVPTQIPLFSSFFPPFLKAFKGLNKVELELFSLKNSQFIHLFG